MKPEKDLFHACLERDSLKWLVLQTPSPVFLSSQLSNDFLKITSHNESQKHTPRKNNTQNFTSGQNSGDLVGSSDGLPWFKGETEQSWSTWSPGSCSMCQSVVTGLGPGSQDRRLSPYHFLTSFSLPASSAVFWKVLSSPPTSQKKKNQKGTPEN